MSVPPPAARLNLRLREPSPIPLEVDGVTPDRVEKLSLLDVAKVPVFHGNRREELGQFFDVTGNPSAGWVHFSGDTRTVKHIGAAMTAGTVYVENHVGMHAGAGMTGGWLVTDGEAGDWLGAEMRGGCIEVRGTAGSQVGAAYRGSRRGMTGGVIVCRGAVGDECGLLMRRGLIVVEGPCGEFAGASMIAGTILIGGRAGARLGAGMKRGTILAAGGVGELPPSFRHSCNYRPTFLPVYLRRLQALGASCTRSVPTQVSCYRGDLLHGGRGEVLIAGDSVKT